MKKVTIEIETTNGVFKPNPLKEISTILNGIIFRMPFSDKVGMYNLNDSNDNRVGKITFE